MNDRSWRAWEYPDDIDVGGGALIGYSVVARDGEIGKVDEATVAVGSSSLVVDTGRWIKNAPAFDPQRHSSAGYRDEIADYYAGWYGASITTTPPPRPGDSG